MLRQMPHDRWCWAATAASLWHFYHQSAELRMCDIVTRVRGENCCDGPSGDCEREAPLERALSAFDLLRAAPIGVIPFEAGAGQPSVVSEIDSGRPVAVALTFGLYTHFCVVHGYERPSGLVAVADSFFDSAPALPYRQLVTNYHDGGRWKRTYLTRS